MLPKAPLADCQKCPGRECVFVPPEPAANGAAAIALIGDSPTKNDLRQRRPFVGQSGRLLGRGLRQLPVALTRGECHWTHAVLCGVKQKELATARKHCAARLQAELAAAAPSAVVPFGKLALQSTLRLSKCRSIMRWRGTVTPARFAEGGKVALVLPTVDPHYLTYTPAWAPVFEVDFARIGRLTQLHDAASWLPLEEAPGREMVVARDLSMLRSALARLASGAPVGFDVETVGLGPTMTPLVCFAISDGQLTVVVPWARDRAGINQWWAQQSAGKVATLVSEAFASRSVVTHNGPAFDHVVMHRYGLRFDRWDDTLLAAHAIASHLPKHLAMVATYHAGLDVPAWKEFEDRTADLERLWAYNGRDTLYTILAWQRLQKQLREAA